MFGSGLDNQRAVTVKSTFLQNRNYLDFYYREAYTVVEMEAGPFCNAVYEIADADRYPQGEAVNFAKLPIDLGIIHYASDTPYTQARTLGARGLSLLRAWTPPTRRRWRSCAGSSRSRACSRSSASGRHPAWRAPVPDPRPGSRAGTDRTGPALVWRSEPCSSQTLSDSTRCAPDDEPRAPTSPAVASPKARRWGSVRLRAPVLAAGAAREGAAQPDRVDAACDRLGPGRSDRSARGRLPRAQGGRGLRSGHDVRLGLGRPRRPRRRTARSRSGTSATSRRCARWRMACTATALSACRR